MNRTVLTYGVLLAVALGASYRTWNSEDQAETADGIVLSDGEPNEIEEIRYETEKQTVTLSARADERGNYIWIKNIAVSTRNVPITPPTPPEEEASESSVEEGAETEADETPEAVEETEEITEEITEERITEFKAGKAGSDLLDKFSPLMAERQLEDVEPGQLEEMGLAEPEGTLTLSRQGRSPTVLEIGGEAFGTRDRYVRDAQGDIYLLAADVLRPLKFATTRLPDRDLLGTKEPEIEELRISDGESELSLEQRNRDDRQAAYWARPEGEGPDQMAAGWLEKFFRLRATGYVQPAEVPTGLTTVFDVESLSADGTSTRLQVYQGTNELGATGWYAKSDHTRELVKLEPNIASDTAAFLDGILNE